MVSQHSLADLFNEGDNCCRVGNYKNAICWYNKELKKEPENIILLTKKANTLHELHQYTKAYDCYVKVLIHTKTLDLITQYVESYQSNVQRDVNTLYDLLKINYSIPITLPGLQFVLKKTQESIDESKQVSEWMHFKKRLQQKRLGSPDEYIDLFLQQFGESFYKHFIGFYCYLLECNIINLTMNQFATIFMEHREKMKLEQFERFLRTGRKQPLFNRMTGSEFVDFLADFFRNRGYLVTKNPVTHDFGADLIISRFGVTTSVQVKHRKQAVGVPAIHEINGGRDYYRTQKAMVISLGGFTKFAVKLAKRIGVQTWDRTRLLDEINKPGF